MRSALQFNFRFRLEFEFEVLNGTPDMNLKTNH